MNLTHFILIYFTCFSLSIDNEYYRNKLNSSVYPKTEKQERENIVKSFGGDTLNNGSKLNFGFLHEDNIKTFEDLIIKDENLYEFFFEVTRILKLIKVLGYQGVHLGFRRYIYDTDNNVGILMLRNFTDLQKKYLQNDKMEETEIYKVHENINIIDPELFVFYAEKWTRFFDKNLYNGLLFDHWLASKHIGYNVEYKITEENTEIEKYMETWGGDWDLTFDYYRKFHFNGLIYWR